MRVLLTGAAGFVGRVALDLLRVRHQVGHPGRRRDGHGQQPVREGIAGCPEHAAFC